MNSLYWLTYVSLNDGSENFVSISNSHPKIDYIRYCAKDCILQIVKFSTNFFFFPVACLARHGG